MIFGIVIYCVLNVTNGSNKSPSYVRWNEKQSSISEQKSFEVLTVPCCTNLNRVGEVKAGEPFRKVKNGSQVRKPKNYLVRTLPVMTSLSSLPVKCENDVATPTGDVVNKGYKTIVFVWKNYYTSPADKILDMTSIFRKFAPKTTFISFEAYALWIVHEYLAQ